MFFRLFFHNIPIIAPVFSLGIRSEINKSLSFRCQKDRLLCFSPSGRILRHKRYFYIFSLIITARFITPAAHRCFIRIMLRLYASVGTHRTLALKAALRVAYCVFGHLFIERIILSYLTEFLMTCRFTYLLNQISFLRQSQTFIRRPR